MKVLLIDNGTTLLEKLKVLIPGQEIVRKWNNLDGIDHQKFDLVVLSGSSNFSVQDNFEQMLAEQAIVRERKKPLIGICWGCQFINKIHGGTLKKMSQKELGIESVTVLTDTPMFDGKKEFGVYENHSWKIDSIASEFIPLARTDHAVCIIRHKKHPIYGFQFHPENMIDSSFGDEVFKNLLQRLFPGIR